MPYQLFIGGEFVDAEGAKTYNTINPTDGSVSRLQSPSFHSPPTCLLGTVARGLCLDVCVFIADVQGSILGHRSGVEQVDEERGERARKALRKQNLLIE